MTEGVHVVFGTGPVGCWLARSLRHRGLAVRAVNRSGRRPGLMPPEVALIAADVSDVAAARQAAAGAATVYQALNPPYHEWERLFPPLQANALVAARAAGARYVSIENLYFYDPSAPIHEDSPAAPRSRKGALRLRMAEAVMDAHRRGDVEACALRSSDYYGPGVTLSAFGERVFAPLVAGKKAQLLGSAVMPHSFAYIEDVGEAAATLGTHADAPGAAWIAPHADALTQAEMVAMIGQALGRPAGFSVISPLMMRLAGLFVPGARASVEMMYQFTAPFRVRTDRMTRRFGLHPTPLEAGIVRAVDWYRGRAH